MCLTVFLKTTSIDVVVRNYVQKIVMITVMVNVLYEKACTNLSLKRIVEHYHYCYNMHNVRLFCFNFVNLPLVTCACMTSLLKGFITLKV